MQAVCSADQSVLACAYCGHFPVDVVETQCSQSCSPLYCWECVVRLDKCVSCAKRIEVERLRPLPFIRQRLSMINVRCEHPGCSAIFKSGERDKHERACPFVQIACSINPSCGTFNRSNLAAHEVNCPYRLVSCPQLCGEQVLAVQLQDHVATCASRLLPCGQGTCKMEVCRSELAAHQAACPQRQVPCSLASIGCPVKCAAEDVHQHLKDDPIHLPLLATECVELRTRINKLEQPTSPTTPSKEGTLLLLMGLVVIATSIVHWAVHRTRCFYFLPVVAIASALLQRSWVTGDVDRQTQKKKSSRRTLLLVLYGFLAFMWMRGFHPFSYFSIVSAACMVTTWLFGQVLSASAFVKDREPLIKQLPPRGLARCTPTGCRTKLHC